MNVDNHKNIRSIAYSALSNLNELSTMHAMEPKIKNSTKVWKALLFRAFKVFV